MRMMVLQRPVCLAISPSRFYEKIVDLKLAVLETYNPKLDIRSERKKFIFDRGLIEFRKACFNIYKWVAYLTSLRS